MPNTFETNSTDITTWYKKSRGSYVKLTKTVQNTVENLINAEDIDYLAINSRTKSIDSLKEKVERKGYNNPDEISDLSGIRIITFIESDVSKVSDLVKKAFSVHPDKSLDKSEELDADRVGYRSVHFVCDLGNDRLKLPEFSAFKDQLFEIQIRTALQHAWAEIEHDRNYKFSGTLPKPIKRRLYLLAGMLEMIDREFVNLSIEVDNYSEEVTNKTQSGDLDIEINVTSLRSYLQEITNKLEKTVIKQSKTPAYDVAIKELTSFGLTSLKDLNTIFNDAYFEALDKNVPSSTELGLFRKAMMFLDIDRFFEEIWQERWREMRRATIRLLESKYGKSKIDEVLETYLINPKKQKKPRKSDA